MRSRARGWGRPLLFVVVLVVAALGGSSAGADTVDLGEENSWIRIQNVGVHAATIEVVFYDLDGNAVTTDACPLSDRCTTLPPGHGWSFFPQGLEELAAGYRGSAYVTVDQPFVSLLARDAFEDGLFRISGDSLRLGAGTAVQYLPLVQNTASQVSRISIENASDETAMCVETSYYAAGALSPVAVDPPGPTPGCPNGGQRVEPRATVVRDEHDLPAPAGFEGSAIVRTYATAEGTAAAAQRPAVIVDTRDREGPGLATYRALDELELSRVVVLQLVDRGASEGQSTWSTRFRIMNGEPGAPNEVTLLFDGVDAAGDRLEIEHTVTVSSALTCDQRVGGVGACLPEGVRLPEVFFGTVRIQAVEPIAVVVQRISAEGGLADYRGFTAEEASRNVLLPVLNKNFGPWGDAKGWNSWFRVLTFDGSVAHVRVIYFSKHFANNLVTPAVTVEGQRTFRQWEEWRLPDGWVGSALVIADRPVVVVVNLESDVFGGDPVMLYNGVNAE